MSGIISSMSGLSAFRNKSPKYFKINADETKRVYIPQELHEMTRKVVHSSPKDFTKSALCTWDNGNCYPCEQGTFPWTGRLKILVPVVQNGQLYIFSQGTGVNSVIWSLGNALDEHGSVVGWYDISRTGQGKRAKYIAERIDNSEVMKYNNIVNLENTFPRIDYMMQEQYYS